MRETFELRDADAAGRIGELSVPRSGVTVETPALLPVVNPNVDTVSPSRLADEFGAEMLITNAYIIHGSEDLRERARSEGLHEMLGFDGAVMTDSGSFQLAEYGDIDVTTDEILRFQYEIGSDVGTPVDVPTPPDADRETARRDLETTRERLATAESVDTGEMLVTAPVQGSTHPDLRERAGEHAGGTDLDVFPVGGVVPLLNDYRFDDVVEVVAAAKRGLAADCPVHLFGAGHPMMFALAVALGCDLFDSAAYALYARDDRYLTVRGTEHLADMEYFPCECPVCVEHDPGGVADLPDDRRHALLAEHNLYVSFGEIRRIRQAIRAGNLLELVETRARAHPAMLSGYRTLADHAGWLERSDPVSKGTFRYLSTESADRPEVRRHHERIERVSVPDRLLLAEDTDVDPARVVPDADRDDVDPPVVWRVLPPFGPVPKPLASTYPLTAEVPDRGDPAAEEAAARGVARLAATSPDSEVTLAHAGWSERALSTLPDGVRVVDLAASGDPQPGRSGTDDGGVEG